MTHHCRCTAVTVSVHIPELLAFLMDTIDLKLCSQLQNEETKEDISTMFLVPKQFALP